MILEMPEIPYIRGTYLQLLKYIPFNVRIIINMRI